jgi:hypothetical protein
VALDIPGLSEQIFERVGRWIREEVGDAIDQLELALITRSAQLKTAQPALARLDARLEAIGGLLDEHE